MGFLGHQVVSLLEDLGHSVVIIDNLTTYGIIPEDELNYLISERQDRIRCTISRPINITDSAVKNIFKTFVPDTVIHLASFPRQKAVDANPRDAEDTMITGLRNICELSAQYNVKKFVFISSSLVYGDFPDNTDENYLCNPIGQYGIMKLAGENLVKEYSAKGYFDYTILRPSAVYGPRDVEDRVVSKFLMNALRGQTLKVNGINETLDFTYVTDTATGIVQAANSNNTNNKTYNITRGNARTLAEAANIAIDLAGNGHLEVLAKDSSFPSRGTLNIDAAWNDFGFDPKIDIEIGFKKYYDYLVASPFWAAKFHGN